MRILIYGLNYAPELVGIGKYTGELAEWLVNQGHQVKVITSPPYYPYWAVQKPYRSWLYKKEKLNGVEVIRCPIWVPRETSWFKRLMHLLSFSISSFPVLLILLRWRPQVLFAVEPTLFSVVFASIVARFGRIKSWLHVQDLEVDAALSLQLISDHRLVRWVQVLERRVTQSFDIVSSISKAMLIRLHAKGIDPARTTMLLNWVDASSFKPVLSQSSLRKEWAISETAQVVMYSGNLGLKQGLEILLQVAKNVAKLRPHVIFLIIGDGVARKQLETICQMESLTNVSFKPLQSLERFPTLLATANIHLVLQRRGAADLVMPSKVGAILAAGGIMLVTSGPGSELYRIVDANSLGLLVEPDSVEALQEGILKLLDDENLRESYKKNAREYSLKEMRKEVILPRFENELMNLILPVGVKPRNPSLKEYVS